MTVHKLPIFALALALAACETTIPASDPVKPVIALSLQDGGLKTLISTSPSATLATGCPAGTSFNAAAANAYVLSTYGVTVGFADDDGIYFHGPGAAPFSFVATVSDQGGAALARVSFNINVSPSQPEGSIVISDLTPAAATTAAVSETRPTGNTYHYRRVELAGNRSDPRTALIVTFKASSLGSQPLVTMRGEDFSGNSEYGLVWLLPRSLCS